MNLSQYIDIEGEVEVAPTTVYVPELINWDNPDYDEIFRKRCQRLQNIRSADDPASVWEGLKAYYKDHPVQFINDWCMTSDPRNPEIGLPATIPFVLFKRQIEFIQWVHDRWKSREDGLAEKSRDMGVSWLCCAIGVWAWLFYNGVNIGYGSRKEDYVDKIGDPKSLFWKIRMIIKNLPMELLPIGWSERACAPSMRVINPANQSTITGEAGDNIGRGARCSIYFVDEAAHIEHPELVDAALAATANCKLYVSSVNGAGNPFYKKRHSGDVPVFVFDWRQDPRKDQAWYEKQCKSLDKVIVAQEIDRNYEAAVGNAFIPADIVLAAAMRGPAQVVAHGGLRVGIDVARFGNDKTAIVFRRGRVMLKTIMLEKNDMMDVASRARSEIKAFGTKPEQIAVDTIGLGAGVADILRGWFPDEIDPISKEVYKTVADVNSSIRLKDGNWYNLRAMMWGEMKEWLKSASIPNDQELKVDLTALRYGFREGLTLLESKDDAKKRGVKSPDRGDALAMTFAIPTMARIQEKKVRIEGYRPSDSSMGL